MIRTHGFEKFLIKNIWINSDSNTDLDLFFNTLRFNFMDNDIKIKLYMNIDRKRNIW